MSRGESVYNDNIEDGAEYTIEPEQAGALLLDCELEIEGIKVKVREM